MQNPRRMRPFRVEIDHNLKSSDCVAEAEGIELRYGNFEISPVQEELQTPRFVSVHKPFEALEFREPYRIHPVQSSGENKPFREDSADFAD
jgi:hypothetical protein